MKRAGRIFYNLAMALSLLLCMATVMVWVRSMWVSDTLGWDDWPEDYSFRDRKLISCGRGGIQFGASRYFVKNDGLADGAHFWHSRGPASSYPVLGDYFDNDIAPTPRHYAALGFEWFPQATGRWQSASYFEIAFKSLTLPLYFPCLLFALLPAHYLLRVRRRRRIAARQAQGRCIFCGYDLRASPARCPECGREAAVKT